MMSRGPAMLAETRTCIQSNCDLLRTSRYRIAASRRRLNPAFGISGGVVPPLRETVRALLASGTLFPVSGNGFAGIGSGKRCVVCQTPISSSEVEYEVDGYPIGAPVCHLTCFFLWREESSAGWE
jgi:hypothetical protein